MAHSFVCGCECMWVLNAWYVWVDSQVKPAHCYYHVVDFILTENWRWNIQHCSQKHWRIGR